MRARTSITAVALTACGTLGSPSTGDVSLPVTTLGPYTLITRGGSPTTTTTLVKAPDRTHLDEPSVVTVNGHRQAFVTVLSADGPNTIGRATETGAFVFGDVTTALAATHAWEMGAVQSPSVERAANGSLVMVYEAAGAIGLATADAGGTFTARAEPIVRDGDDDALDGGAPVALGQPAIARAPDGTWWLAYVRGGSLVVRHANTPEGPWNAVGSGLGPATADGTGGDGGMADGGADAGGPFDGLALSDPAWAIETTAAGRTSYGLFYTATGTQRYTQVGAAGSFDGTVFVRTGRAALIDTGAPVHVGSFERIDARTAVLWVADGADGDRHVTAALGPAGTRVRSPFDP